MKTVTRQNQHREATVAPITIPPRVVTAPMEPEFRRLPKPGQLDPLTGLARSALNALILPTPQNDFKPPVRSFVLRQKGARTGIRLISWPSLKSYILAHEEAAQHEPRRRVAAKG